MDSNRRTALSAGVLFITATAASIAGTALSQPALNQSDYLSRLSTDGNLVTGGALLGFVAAVASVGIAIALYPVLKQWNVGLALGSVVFRTMEAVMYTVGVVSLLCLSTLGQQFTSAGSADRASLQAFGDLLLNVRDQANVPGVLAFSLGALMYYYLFFQSRLIPRWLSGWGIAAIILMMVACVLAAFSHNPVTTYVILALPIAVQEMVLAVWLIARGFNTTAVESRTATGSEHVMLPQARVLEFITHEASRYPTFHLALTARVEHLVEEDGVVRGVRYSDGSERHELRAPLVVGADGRSSKVRQLITADMIHSAQPIDSLSFKAAKPLE